MSNRYTPFWQGKLEFTETIHGSLWENVSQKGCCTGMELCGAITEKTRVLHMFAVGGYSVTRPNSVI
jgi:hypothetical protein